MNISHLHVLRDAYNSNDLNTFNEKVKELTASIIRKIEIEDAIPKVGDIYTHKGFNSYKMVLTEIDSKFQLVIFESSDPNYAGVSWTRPKVLIEDVFGQTGRERFKKV